VTASEADKNRRRPTINDIARLAKVSKKTVSRVINDSPFVREETREKIAAIIQELGYTPDPQARGLAFRRSFLIGMVYDNPNPQYVVNVQQGILDAVRGSGFELVVHPTDRSSRSALSDIRTFVERQKLFGVVLTPSISEDEDLVRVLKEVDCPYVRVASVALDDPDVMLVTEDRRGGREAALHLADLGHRRVAFVSGPPSFRSSRERREGFVEGLAERGLALPDENVLHGAYTFDSGVAAGEALLKLDPRPTAVFAGNDEMATGVLYAARRAGLDVPGDLSVVGYDDFQIASRIWPPLTTVRAPTREVGRLAAEKLLSLSGREPRSGGPREDVAPRLMVRESSGPPRSG
jgi:LacI family transcriptional regulator